MGKPNHLVSEASRKSTRQGIKVIPSRTFNYKVYPITPVAAPRMTKGDKALYRSCVVKYMQYRNVLKAMIKYEDVCWNPLSLQFCIPMPKSWTDKKKKEYNLKPHQNEKDLDNLVKAFKDALCKHDGFVWSYDMMSKVWAYEGSVIVLNLQEQVSLHTAS